MAPLARKMLRWTTVVATGCKRVGRMKRTNRRILVPASMLLCAIEEKLTLENVNGEEVKKYETKMVNKDGYTITFFQKCPRLSENDGEG